MLGGDQRGPHVDHVVWCVRRESLSSLERFWGEALGVPLVSFEIAEQGISVLMSWDAGVEIVAPSAVAGSFTAALDGFLAARGEGVFSTVYEVPDIAAAVQRAVAAGATVVFEESIEPAVLAERLGWPSDRPAVRLRQALLTEVAGTTVCLQQSDRG